LTGTKIATKYAEHWKKFSVASNLSYPVQKLTLYGFFLRLKAKSHEAPTLR
jgi:hypothetical protein